MSVLPVVAREMGVLARRRSTYVARTLTAAMAMFVAGWLFLVAVAGLSVASMGQSVFTGLSCLGFVYALFAGIYASSDALSEEKREGTLGLLFLTDLRSYDVTLGKLAATSLNSVYALMALIPTISLAILLGGVGLGNVAKVSLVLGNTMFFSLSVGMLVSALSVNERRAIFASLIIVLFISVGPFIITLVASAFEKLPVIGLWPSPFYPFLCVFSSTGSPPGFDSSLFYVSLGFQHLAAWACLAGATALLPAFVRGISIKFRENFGARFHQYVYGTPGQRRRDRAGLLDRNAFLWLAARERIKPLWAWITIAIFFAIYGWVALGYNGILFDLHTSATILFLVHLVLKVWVASEVCTRVIQDRRSGAIELLLSSPLSVREIARGQDLALRRIFAGPVTVLILSECVLMFMAAKFMHKPPLGDRIVTYIAAGSTLLLDIWALKWLGLWLSLFARSIERVMVATIARVMLAPWLVFFAYAAVFSAMLGIQGRRPTYHELLWTWWRLSVVFAVAYAVSARRNFLRHCREAVADQHQSPGALARASASKPRVGDGKGSLIASLLRRRPALSAVTIATILAVLGLLARRLYWEARLHEKIAALRARNEPTRILDLPKFYRPVPKQENAFARLADAGRVNRFVSPNWDWRILPFSSSNYLRGLGETNQAMYAAALKRNGPQLTALDQAVQLTNAYIEPFNTSRYNQAPDFHFYGELAVIDFVLAIEAHDMPRFEKAAERVFRYAALLRKQPSWLTQNAALNLLNKASTALELAFYRDVPSAESLARLRKLVRQADSADAVPRLLSISRGQMIDPVFEAEIFSQRMDAFAGTRRAFSELIGTRQKQLSRVLDLFDESEHRYSGTPFERFQWAQKLSFYTQSPGSPAPSLEFLNESYIRWTQLIDLRILVQLRLLETALALQQYFRAHGEYPASLQGLVPEFVAAVPQDPFSGATLAWKESSDGRVLWSFGPNGVDDGGAYALEGTADLVFHFWGNKESELPATHFSDREASTQK